MKKSITICALAAGALALSSCSDFLDQNSPSELSQEHVFTMNIIQVQLSTKFMVI